MIRISIVCDECGTTGEYTQGTLRDQPWVVRVRLKEKGWKIAQLGGRDYCPECYSKVVRENSRQAKMGI
jgi:hypothetical protein